MNEGPKTSILKAPLWVDFEKVFASKSKSYSDFKALKTLIP